MTQRLGRYFSALQSLAETTQATDDGEPSPPDDLWRTLKRYGAVTIGVVIGSGTALLLQDVAHLPLLAIAVGSTVSVCTGLALHAPRPPAVFEVLMDEEGTPYVPLPEDAEGNLRQIVPCSDGVGWKLVVLTPLGVEVRASGSTVQAVMASTRRAMPAARPVLQGGAEIVPLRRAVG